MTIPLSQELRRHLVRAVEWGRHPPGCRSLRGQSLDDGGADAPPAPDHSMSSERIGGHRRPVLERCRADAGSGALAGRWAVLDHPAAHEVAVSRRQSGLSARA